MKDMKEMKEMEGDDRDEGDGRRMCVLICLFIFYLCYVIFSSYVVPISSFVSRFRV